MPIIDIHGKKVHVDDDSHSAKSAAEYMIKHKDNADAYFQAAHHDHANGVHHFEIPHHENPNESHHFTLIHNSTDGTYELRKRHQY